jgi:PPOX class probable F420-dependent enzyme
MELSQDLLDLLRMPATCYVATINADGSPQLTQTWVDTDGEHVVINTVQGFVKLRNMERDPRVAVTIDDPANRIRYKQIQGRVVETTTEGGAEHIEAMSRKYTGQPYAWYGGRDQVRVIVKIEADKISGVG